jgi:hypothetical protein
MRQTILAQERSMSMTVPNLPAHMVRLGSR